MKLLLILAGDRIYRCRGMVASMVLYAPLTLTALTGFEPEEFQSQIDLVDEGVQKPCYERKQYDVVGINCAVSAALRAYRLAQDWRWVGRMCC